MTQDSPEKIKAALEQVKERLARGEYGSARLILSELNHPKRDEWMAKVDEREAEFEGALNTPAKTAASVKKLSKRSPMYRAVLIGILLILIGIGVVAIQKFRADTMQAADAAREVISQLMDETELVVYCESVLEKPDNDPGCAAWSKTMIDTQLDRLKTCEAAYDWITETDEYTACLILGGVSVFSRTKLTGSTEFDTSDYEAMAPLSLLCKQSRSDDYCVAWSWYVYTAFRSQVKPCVQYRLDLGDYAGCIAGEGIATP